MPHPGGRPRGDPRGGTVVGAERLHHEGREEHEGKALADSNATQPFTVFALSFFVAFVIFVVTINGRTLPLYIASENTA